MRFLRANTDRADPEKATITEVVEALHELDKRILKGHYLKPDQQIKLHMPIYFWIADQQKAIFTIPTVGRSFEHGFLTSDHALIQALLEMYQRYTKAAIAASPAAKSKLSREHAPDALPEGGGRELNPE